MTWLYIFALFASLVIFFVSGDGKFNTFTDPTLQFIVREWFTNPGEAWPYVLIMGIVASISFFCVFTAYSIASPSVVSLSVWCICCYHLTSYFFSKVNIEPSCNNDCCT